MGLPEILTGAGVVLALTATILKLFSSTRLIKSLEEKVTEINDRCAAITEKEIVSEKDIVRLNEFQKQVDKDLDQLKADLVREAQIMSNQLNVVHQKIDHIDEKLDKIRDRQLNHK